MDPLYIQNSIAYQNSLRLERVKNLFAIVASIFTIAAAIHLMTKKQ